MEYNKNLLENYQFEGEELRVFTYPSPVLKEVAKPVEKFDEELELLIKNMLYTMYQAPGIGLAAPQVGISKRIFVMDIDFDREEVTKADGESEYRYSNFNPRVFINRLFPISRVRFYMKKVVFQFPGFMKKLKGRNQSLLSISIYMEKLKKLKLKIFFRFVFSMKMTTWTE